MSGFPDPVSVRQGGSVSPYTSDCRAPGQNGIYRQRRLGRDCLEISDARGRSMPLGSGVFRVRVSIWQGGACAHDTSNYTTPKQNWADRQRGLGPDYLEISVIACRNRPLVFGIFPDPFNHLTGRVCCALYSELHDVEGKTGPIDSGDMGSTFWKYQSCLGAPCH